MSQVAISGNASGTGTLTIAAPNTNSNRTLTLPDGTGTFTVNGVNSNIVSGTAQASTSGTSIDFTGIPSWVKRITITFAGVSTNGTSPVMTQGLTSGGAVTSGYLGAAVYLNTSTSAQYSSGFLCDGLAAPAATIARNGIITLVNQTSNTWAEMHTLAHSGDQGTEVGGGQVSLGAVLTGVRITTVGGTNTFDAGSINILYE